MKTKLALMTALLAFTWSFAQEGQMNLQLKAYSKKIDSTIAAEKVQMNLELDELEKNFNGQEITDEEKQKQRTAIAAKYEAIINGKVADRQSELESATREMVKDAVLGRSRKYSLVMDPQSNALLTFKSPEKTYKDLLSRQDFNISFGFMNLTGSAGSLAIGNNESQMKVGKSTSSQFEFRFTRQIGPLTSPVFYRTGFGYRQDIISPEKPKVFVQDLSDAMYLADFTSANLRKSSFRNHYIMVPLDFVFVLDPQYTVENDEKLLDNSKGNFRLAAGIYGGVRVASQNYFVYKNEKNHSVKNVENMPEVANNFIFGGKLSLGYKAINIFIKKDFTPIFNDNAKINNKYGIQIGLELLYIDF